MEKKAIFSKVAPPLLMPVMMTRAKNTLNQPPSFDSFALPFIMSQQYEEVAAFLASKTRFRPQIGIICGSGLSGLSKSLTSTQTFKYEDIPGFPQATVPGHAGELVFGLLGGIETVCMRGRFHFYEGNTMEKVVMPIKVMRLLGVKLLIVTNAAGGLNPEFNVGDIMVIQDHFGAVSWLN
jgi:purine-nucleoside phosphorylase